MERKAFSTVNWYKQFNDITIPTKSIPLQKEIVEYILSDGIILPSDLNGSDLPYERMPDSDFDDTDNEDESEEQAAPQDEYPWYPDFHSRVSDAIEELDGAVFPKLDWSAPQDAAFMAFDGTLKCSKPNDILLLLKSSDFVTHDLTQSSDDHQFHVVLKKWEHILPSTEFRCFVKNGSLVAVCQRDIFNFYSFLLHKASDIKENLLEFFNQFIKGKFTENNFVFDVWVKDLEFNSLKSSIVLIDFNPWAEYTETCLFTWDELESINEDDQLDFRIVECQEDIRGTSMPKYSMNRMPLEATLLSEGRTLQEFARDFYEELEKAELNL